MKYKAKDSYKSAKNKHFGVHKVKILETGGFIEITDFDDLPKDVKEHLEPLTKKKVSKAGTKKKEKENK